jgi:coenzyme F420-0:L-glutamate ligase/coenzyme F420-1:gamma-L-glutamate ligase
VATTIGIPGLPEIAPGGDLAGLVAAALADVAWPDGSVGPADGDVVVVTSKVVSKAEGRVVAAGDREDAITAETVRVVAERATPAGTTRIVQTRHGLVMAAAGVDASNTASGTVVLLPVDPDASARAIRAELQALLQVRVGVVISDSFGRPWREGLTDVAVGAAGLTPVDDHRGRTDTAGHTLEMTVTAIADEVAAAAELVKGNTSRVPVAIIRGFAHEPDDEATMAPVIRDSSRDLFR